MLFKEFHQRILIVIVQFQSVAKVWEKDVIEDSVKCLSLRLRGSHLNFREFN